MENINSAIVIPSRMGSSRLPSKPLIDLNGKPLIEWVINNALKSKLASSIIVATDNKDIANIANKLGVKGVMTSDKHLNGTERLIEVAEKNDFETYINLQGDEPFINPHDIDKLIKSVNNDESDIISLCHKTNLDNAKDNSVVKVVFDNNNNAMYFSRSIIPYNAYDIYQHVGIYGFTKNCINKIKELKPSKLESQERLEQVRWLEAGLKIKMLVTKNKSLGIDIKNDIEKAKKIIFSQGLKGIISDVDGVLTDGKLFYGPSGEEYKVFHAHDGLAIKKLINMGINVGLISARDSKPLRKRAAELGVKFTQFGEEDKVKSCKIVINKMGLSPDSIAYIGDDDNDINPANLVGWSYAVANASNNLKSHANQTLTKSGGAGVFSEIIQEIVEHRSNIIN